MSSLRQQVVLSFFWNAIQKYSAMFVSLVVSMVMARILTPEDFGVVAIAMIVISFLNIFATIGIGPAIIQNRNLLKEDLNQIFTFSVYLAVVLSIVLYCAASPIALYFENKILVPVCKILCIDVFFTTINMVPTALMSKDKRFKEMAIRTVVISVCSGIISIFSVFMGLGIYSLLISPITTAIGLFLYNYHYYPLLFEGKLSIAPFRKIFKYSFFQFSFQLVGFFQLNIDKMIIAKLITPSSLGYYDKAHSLIKLPLSVFSGVITPSLHPYLSDFQDNVPKIEEIHRLTIKYLSSLCLPASIIMLYSGAEIIGVLYGPQWTLAVPAFQILCATIPINVILSTSGAYWQASNSTNLLFWTGLTNAIIIIAGYFISSYISATIESIAIGYFITSSIVFYITYKIMYKCVFKMPIKNLLRLLINPIFNAIILIVVFESTSIYININNALLSLLFKSFIGITSTLIFVQVTGRFDFLGLIRYKFTKQ